MIEKMSKGEVYLMMRLSKRKINFHIYYIQYDRVYVEMKHVTVIPDLERKKNVISTYFVHYDR